MLQEARDVHNASDAQRLAQALRPLHERIHQSEMVDGLGPVDMDRVIPNSDADSDGAAEALPNEAAQDLPREPAPRQATRVRRNVNLDRPLGEYSNNRLILFGGMPHLFPVAITEGQRKFEKPPVLNTVRRLLLNKEKRWGQDGNFLFYHFNSHRRHELARSVRSSQKSWEIAQELLEDDDLLEKLEAADGSPESNRVIERVAKGLRFVNRRVPFSNAARRSELSTLLGMHAFMGCSGIFVTINPCDNDVRLTIEQITNGDPVKHDYLLRNKFARTAAVQANPAYAAESFGLLMDAVVEHLFGIKLDSKTPACGSCAGVRKRSRP
jgi:sulfur relay (sulfurtransferase) DsrF/TusC family protein